MGLRSSAAQCNSHKVSDIGVPVCLATYSPLAWVILSAAKLPQAWVWRKKITTVNKYDCSLLKWLFKISEFHASTLEGCAAMLLGWHFLIFWKSFAFVTSEYINVVTPHQKTVTQSYSITSQTMWILMWPVMSVVQFSFMVLNQWMCAVTLHVYPFYAGCFSIETVGIWHSFHVHCFSDDVCLM
jgi:hypothetical protein